MTTFKDLFSHHATDYARFRPHYPPELFAWLAGLSPGRALAVDVGSGNGQAAAALGQDFDQVIAVDPSAEQIANAPVAPAGTVSYRKGTAECLPVDSGTADLVVAAQAFHWFKPEPFFAEVRRVLRPGGTFVFNAWDRIEANAFTATVVDALTQLFRDDAPVFLANVAHGYHDTDVMRADVAAGGFTEVVAVEAVEVTSRAGSFRDPAIGFCQGSPMRNEIETRHPSRLREATEAAASAVEARFGTNDISGPIRAYVVTVRH